jgi:hypothetical protein
MVEFNLHRRRAFGTEPKVFNLHVTKTRSTEPSITSHNEELALFKVVEAGQTVRICTFGNQLLPPLLRLLSRGIRSRSHLSIVLIFG